MRVELFFVPLAVDLSSHVDGAAMRRQQQRLRSMLRHERQSIAIVLAEALHHSAGPSKKKVVERRERQKEEVHETHVAQREPKTPPPGTRPGPPPEPAPQVRLEAAARALVVNGLPTFTLPVLAGSAGEAIDSGALSFLQKQLAPVVEDEEKEAQLVVDVPESVEWVQLSNPTGKTYYWNRRSGKTAWNPPEGLKVVWCGRRDHEGEVHGLTCSVRTTSLHFLQGEGATASPGMQILGAVPCNAGFSLVTFLFALCSLWLLSGLRCSASWPVWTRRTVARSSSILAVLCARLALLVFRLAFCSLWLSAGQRACRFGPEAQFCSWLGFTGRCSSGCAPVLSSGPRCSAWPV